MHDLPYYKCFFCNRYCHRECSSKSFNKVLHLNFGQDLGYGGNNRDNCDNKGDQNVIGNVGDDKKQ